MQSESTETARLRVLVIDDNPAHSEGLAELLQLSGFEATNVLTGGAGIAYALTHPLDAVILDMNLPDMNGFAVCRALRRDPRTAEIAVVFHSAQGSVPGARHEGDAYLNYPVAMSELYATIRNSVAKRRSRFEGLIL